MGCNAEGKVSSSFNPITVYQCEPELSPLPYYSMTFDDLRGFLYSERKTAGPAAFLDTKVMGGGCNKQCYVTEKLHCVICGLFQTTSFRQSGP